MQIERKMEDVVTAMELAAIKKDRARLEILQGEVDRLAISLAMREEEIVARIEAGVPVDGQAVVVTRRRQNISWLTVVKRELGECAIVQAKDEWPVSFYKELQIA